MQINKTDTQQNALTAVKLEPKSNSTATFGDILNTVVDTVNPLQHIPIVSSIYENVTGDSMSSIASIIGGGLYGGIIGAATSLGDRILQESTGKNVFGHSLSLFINDSQTSHITSISHNSVHSTANTAVQQTASQTINKFYDISAKDYKSTLQSLGMEDENIRQQYIGSLDEKAKDLL